MYDEFFSDAIREAVKYKPAPVVVDSAKDDDTFSLDAAIAFADTNNRMQAVSAMHEWLETDDLDENETLSDRLLNLCVGVATDGAVDGELTDDEQECLDIVLDAAGEWLVKQGVEPEDVNALLNDWCADTASNVHDYLLSIAPEGEADIINYVFDNSDDSAFDAAYKKVTVIRNGKKVRKNKRISGTVRLSAKQKMGLKKAQRRSHNALASVHRAKSMRIRGKMGLDRTHRPKVV